MKPKVKCREYMYASLTAGDIWKHKSAERLATICQGSFTEFRSLSYRAQSLMLYAYVLGMGFGISGLIDSVLCKMMKTTGY